MSDLKEIQEVLDRKVNADDTDGLEKKLLDCINLLGKSARIKAIAQKRLFNAKGIVLEAYPNEKTAKLKLIMDSETSEEQSDLILADRLNVALAKAIDGLKAIMNISKEQNLKW